MAVKTPNSKEEQDSAYNPGALHAAEQFPESYATHGTDQAEAFANDPANKTENIDATKEKEQEGSDLSVNYTGSGSQKSGRKDPVTFKGFMKKNGPLGAIVGGGGILAFVGGGFVGPAGALVHLKEILVNKFDSMTSVVTVRSNLGMKNRMFGTNATCKIKVRCRFSGMTQRQMDRLRIQGAELVDANGKPLQKNKLGRYTGGKTFVMPDGTKIDAKDYMKQMRSNPKLRDFSRTIFAPRYLSWNDKISKDIRAKKRLVTNPEWGKDEKEARKNVFKATAGEGLSADAKPASDKEKYETDEDGNIKKDKNGDPIPKNQNQGSVDLGDATSQVNDDSSKLAEKAANGEDIGSIPSDPAGAAAMPDTPVKKSALGSALGFLNPADFIVGLCTTYNFANTIVLATEAVALVGAMRYASQFLSTADKIKAGEATSDDVEQSMKILQKEDQYGDAFGDSVGYQYSEYGTIPDKAIASTATGNGVILTLAAAIGWINSHIGRKVVKTSCNVLSNPVVQGLLSLTSFIPGGGQIAKIATKAISKTAEEGAKALIKKEVDNIVKKIAEKVTKDELKKVAKKATKEFIKLAASAGGIFLAGFFIQKYAIPYLARIMSGTEYIGLDGVSAMDTITNGFDATNTVTAQERGLTPLTKDEYTAFKEFNQESTDTYVADMRAQSNPFDVTDPYSASNSLAASFYTFISGIKSSSLLTAPAAILSAFNPSQLLTSSAFAAEPHYCSQESDLVKSKNLATSPFCNVQYGFNDINMMNDKDPNTVIDWMLDHKQIDNDGNPKKDSDFEDFMSKCITDSGNKTITEFGEDDQQLPEECYDEAKNKTEQYKMFRLYVIDGGVANAMDDSGDSGSASSTSDKTEGVTF